MDVILIMLATARITRLITTDRITERPRSAIIRRLDPQGVLAYLVVCDWCSSVYAGAAVAGAWWAWGDSTWFTVLLMALSASYAAGFLNSRTED